MITNGNPIQYAGQPVVGVTDPPCPSCGHRSQIASRIFRMVPKSILSLNHTPNGPPGQIQVEAQAVEAFSLCLYCLRREVFTAENGIWKLQEVIDTIAVETCEDKP